MGVFKGMPKRSTTENPAGAPRIREANSRPDLDERTKIDADHEEAVRAVLTKPKRRR